MERPIEHSTLLVLSLLSREDMYGYQMIVELERRSEKVFHMKEGTLYPVLKKLENAGLIKSYAMECNGRTRKYYHITEAGLSRLKTETKEWEDYAHGIGAVLGSSPALA